MLVALIVAALLTVAVAWISATPATAATMALLWLTFLVLVKGVSSWQATSGSRRRRWRPTLAERRRSDMTSWKCSTHSIRRQPTNKRPAGC